MRTIHETREIEVKIVFVGPGVGGKTTNIQQLHQLLPPEQRSAMKQLETVSERTLLFDLMPVAGPTIDNYKVRYKLVSVAGQAFYISLQQTVLRGADGFVFVADSSPDRQDANEISLYDLHDLCARNNETIKPDTPLVMQYNKRDVSDAVAIEQLNMRLNPWGLPAFGAVAAQGINVMETFECISQGVVNRIAARLQTPAI